MESKAVLFPMAVAKVAFLGPEATFSHLVACRRFGRRSMVPLPTITEVFNFVAAAPGRLGIVPSENSSGGTIYETVDNLIENAAPLRIREELSLNVRLALLGHKGDAIHTAYSHFAPLEYSKPWFREHMPEVLLKAAPSTAEAAQSAAREKGAGALGNREAAKIYGLDIIKFPIDSGVPNQTQFFVIGHETDEPEEAAKTSLVVALKNSPGSLCSFLEPFRDAAINLTRIVSRPVRQQPKTYIFFIDIDGKASNRRVKKALKTASESCDLIRIAGSYPDRAVYES